MFYHSILRPILFSLPPDPIHSLILSLGALLGRTALGRSATAFVYGYPHSDASVTVDGLHFRTPIMLAAGFDYNARIISILPSVGFGGVEVGSITARASAGNNPPQLMRLPRSKSILVNKGLKNDGVDIIISRICAAKVPDDFVIGVSVARTNDRGSAGEVEGIADYCYSLRRLKESGTGHYYTLNISCPNSFTGELFTSPPALGRLLTAVDALAIDKPLYIKLPISFSWEELRVLIDVARAHRIQGFVIGNLHKDYSLLKVEEREHYGRQGGLSGIPCRANSTELIRKTRAYIGPGMTIIGCGGIFSPEDAEEKLHAGADINQLITGMIYEGPGLMSAIARRYAANLSTSPRYKSPIRRSE